MRFAYQSNFSPQHRASGFGESLIAVAGVFLMLSHSFLGKIWEP